MPKKLYVGNLPFSVTKDTLEKLFSEKGMVLSVNVITDSVSGRSKGFGFVEMEKNEDADKAIRELNGTEVEGRAIVVNEARPPREGGGGGGRREGRGGGGGGGGFRRR